MKTPVIFAVMMFLCLFVSHNGYPQELKQTGQELTEYQGSTVIEQVYSPGLEGNLLDDPATQPVKIYLPPGYENYPNNEYPVVYLLHGHTQDYNAFYSWYGMGPLLNELISRKIIAPVVVVTPNGYNKFTGCMYTNSYVSGNWEDYIVQDVVRHMEGQYRILNQTQSRGLGGFSSGGYGTVKLAMKHPSVFSSMCAIGTSITNFEERFLADPTARESIIIAAGTETWSLGLPSTVRNRFSNAVAFAPDSTALPALGRFPFTAEGEFIDSIWQKWLKHDPFTILQTHKDSLQKLQAIQLYVGDSDFVKPQTDFFHQALVDHGIEHGYEVYDGPHNPEPVLDDLLKFFSEHLAGVVPAIKSSSGYYLEPTESLVVNSSSSGQVYIVPFEGGLAFDSIHKNFVAMVEIPDPGNYEFQLSDLDYGRYRVFAQTPGGVVSNIPEEFCLVPDKSPPGMILESDTVLKGDPIKVTSDRDATLSLIIPFAGIDTFRTVFEILSSPRMFKSVDALADTETTISTDDLATRVYWIYSYDQYGIVSDGPKIVEVVANTGPTGKKARHQPEIELFPNPVNEIATIRLKNQDIFEITLVTLNGQQVYSGRFKGNTHQIDLSAFPKGVYIIQFRSDFYVATRKIIKL